MSIGHGGLGLISYDFCRLEGLMPRPSGAVAVGHAFTSINE